MLIIYLNKVFYWNGEYETKQRKYIWKYSGEGMVQCKVWLKYFVAFLSLSMIIAE
jgi:hypothetical protein